jgi:acetyl-CoA carboxylase/biotin carboxylase 1
MGKSVIVGRGRLGNPHGCHAVETRRGIIPATILHIDELACSVLPKLDKSCLDSSYKTAQALRDFDKEGLL